MTTHTARNKTQRQKLFRLWAAIFFSVTAFVPIDVVKMPGLVLHFRLYHAYWFALVEPSAIGWLLVSVHVFGSISAAYLFAVMWDVLSPNQS